MSKKDTSSENPMFYSMVGSLVAMHSDGYLNDIDLYNSILRLIYSGGGADKEELKKIISWLNKEEKNNSDSVEQYSTENVRHNAGEDYLEGLHRAMAPLSESEANVQKLANKLDA